MRGPVTSGLVFPFGYGEAFPDWVDVTTPAAGATASYTVAGENAVRLIAARSTLTTDANAANRSHTVDYLDARGITRVRNGAGLVVTANTTAQTFEWSSARTVAEWAANTPVYVPLLPAILPPGFTIKFTVTNIQAGDTLTGLSLYVEKFPTGPEGYLTGAGVRGDGA
jgi:hypothetical protein